MFTKLTGSEKSSRINVEIVVMIPMKTLMQESATKDELGTLKPYDKMYMRGVMAQLKNKHNGT